MKEERRQSKKRTLVANGHPKPPFDECKQSKVRNSKPNTKEEYDYKGLYEEVEFDSYSIHLLHHHLHHLHHRLFSRAP